VVSPRRAAAWCAALPGASPDEAAEGVRQPEVPAVAEEPRQVAAAVRDEAAAVPQPAAERAAAVALRQAAVRVAAEVQRQAAVQAAAAERQPEAAPDVAGVLLRGARGEPLAARPSAAAWAAPLCLQVARLAPSAAARFARAMRGLRIALP
jgi:hypothetical protein